MKTPKNGLFRRKKAGTDPTKQRDDHMNEAGEKTSNDVIPAEHEVKADASAAGEGSDVPAGQTQKLEQSATEEGEISKIPDSSDEAKNTPDNSQKDGAAEPFSFRFDENGIAFDDDTAKAQNEKDDKSKKPNQKKKIFIGVAVAIGVLIVLIIAVSFAVSSMTSSIKEVKATPLKRGNVENLVNADGNVVSTSTAVVSNSSGMRISEVYVSVGDYVNEGDALCYLQADSSSQNSAMSMAYGGDAAAAAPSSQTVTANADGVVTSVKAEIGGSASGDLFSIQNTDSLMIEVSVSETDINKVGIGMPVRITSEGTANRQYTGTVATIAPTSSETAAVTSGNASAGFSGLSGAAAGSSSPTYKVNVNLNLPTDGLRIGMKTNQDIVIDSHKDVFVVSYDALVKNGDNSYQIYVAEEADGIKTVKGIPVSVGLQGDASVEVISDQLQENMQVIQETDKVSVGDKVLISDKSNAADKGK